MDLLLFPAAFFSRLYRQICLYSFSDIFQYHFVTYAPPPVFPAVIYHAIGLYTYDSFLLLLIASNPA